MRTFSIQTLGCKVNQYESQQIAALLAARGMIPADSPEQADLRVVHTCCVTVQAASKSRQTVRRLARLPVLQSASAVTGAQDRLAGSPACRTVVTGCWATSDRAAAAALPGVDAVLTHHDDLAAELNHLLDAWNAPASPCSTGIAENARGTRSLPLLSGQQTGHQRALLKVQDGCDAFCTYCIIPRLRSRLWSKSIADTVEEARHLVAAGHAEIVLTGIFLGAYGRQTALRHRQPRDACKPLVQLVEALCTQVPGLRRLRFSSLEPGDLTDDLLAVMKSHPQVVPHLHLPLQSGSDIILRRMNRQYRRDDYLRMIDAVHKAFDRPAITTDIIVGFPGETDEQFQRTLQIVDHVRFIHIHAFSFSPRPGTAAARWTSDFVRGPVVNERIRQLTARAAEYSFAFRSQFLGGTVEVLVECDSSYSPCALRHGRCERYFTVHFDDPSARPGDTVCVRIEKVTMQGTFGNRS